MFEFPFQDLVLVLDNGENIPISLKNIDYSTREMAFIIKVAVTDTIHKFKQFVSLIYVSLGRDTIRIDWKEKIYRFQREHVNLADGVVLQELVELLH